MYTTHQVKMGTHVLFDEVHFTIPASQTPFAAQTLQLFDYSNFNNEFQLGKFISPTKLKITCINSDVISPTKSTSESIGLDVFHSMVSICIPSLECKVVDTCFHIASHLDSYIKVEPPSNVHSTLHTLPGVIDSSSKCTVKIMLQNLGK